MAVTTYAAARRPICALARAAVVAALVAGPAGAHAQLEARARNERLSFEPHAQLDSREIVYRPAADADRFRLLRTGLRSERRYGETSDAFDAAVAYAPDARMRLEAQLGASAGATPRREAELALHRRIARDWSLAAAVGGSHDGDGPLWTSRTQLNRDLGRWRFSAGVAHSHPVWPGAPVSDAGSQQAFGAVRYARDRWSIGLRLSERVDAASPDDGPARSRSGMLTVARGWRSAWQLNASLVQALTGPDATGLRIALSRRF